MEVNSMTPENTIKKPTPETIQTIAYASYALRLLFLIISVLVVIIMGLELFQQKSPAPIQPYAVQEQLGLVPGNAPEGMFDELRTALRGDTFVGTWETKDGHLFLRKTASGVYSGTYTIDGVLGAVDLFTDDRTSLSGTLWLEGSSYAFSLRLNGKGGLISEVGELISSIRP